jgi:membrane protein YdbS with pleckstrin-like domain
MTMKAIALLTRARRAVVSNETLKAFVVLLIALAAAGIIWGVITQAIPSISGGIIGFVLGGLVLFIIYRWLVKTLRAPPA